MNPSFAAVRPEAPGVSESAAETVEAIAFPLPALDDPSGEMVSTRGRQGKTIVGSQGIPREEHDSATGGDIDWEGNSPVDTWTNVQRIEEQGPRKLKERRQKMGRKDRKGDRGTERAGNAEEGGGNLANTAGCKGTRAEGDAGDGAAGGRRIPGSLSAPIARDPTKRMRGRAAIATTHYDAVLPIALPGETHEASLGAVARGVVLVSGSSRFQVSRCELSRPLGVTTLVLGLSTTRASDRGYLAFLHEVVDVVGDRVRWPFPGGHCMFVAADSNRQQRVGTFRTEIAPFSHFA